MHNARKNPVGFPHRDGIDVLVLAGPAKEAPAFSEDALALTFADRHADDLRYVAAWSKWFRWTDRNWAEDTTLHAMTLFEMSVGK